MSFNKLGAGSILVDDVRQDLSEQSLPAGRWFVIRATQAGPLALTHLAVNLNILLNEPVKTTNGWIAVEITRPLRIGDFLSWSVFLGFRVAEMAAFLVIDKKTRKLSSKTDVKAGTSWANHVELSSSHIDLEGP